MTATNTLGLTKTYGETLFHYLEDRNDINLYCPTTKSVIFSIDPATGDYESLAIDKNFDYQVFDGNIYKEHIVVKRRTGTYNAFQIQQLVEAPIYYDESENLFSLMVVTKDSVEEIADFSLDFVSGYRIETINGKIYDDSAKIFVKIKDGFIY